MPWRRQFSQFRGVGWRDSAPKCKAFLLDLETQSWGPYFSVLGSDTLYFVERPTSLNLDLLQQELILKRDEHCHKVIDLDNDKMVQV